MVTDHHVNYMYESSSSIYIRGDVSIVSIVLVIDHHVNYICTCMRAPVLYMCMWGDVGIVSHVVRGHQYVEQY